MKLKKKGGGAMLSDRPMENTVSLTSIQCSSTGLSPVGLQVAAGFELFSTPVVDCNDMDSELASFLSTVDESVNSGIGDIGLEGLK